MSWHSWPETPRAVHPHMRGDHMAPGGGNKYLCGSSSHAWGPLMGKMHSWRRCRFILTCVGTTQTHITAILTIPVHPHMRGDHVTPQVQSDFASVRPHVGGDHGGARSGWVEIPGSSPRGWGPRNHRYAPESLHRFIPTWVGTTFMALAI